MELGQGGVGHGSYLLFNLLFPYATILAITLDRFWHSSALMILVAVLQFPLYGIILGRAIKKGAGVAVAIGIVVLHVTFALMIYWSAR